ncbi:MAG TPA: MarR family transcriptional regulator [Mycobacteriales bacterium]
MTTATTHTPLDAEELRRVEEAVVSIVRGVMHVSHQFDSGLDKAGYVTLVVLDRCGTVRQTDLACRLALDLSTVSRQIKHLEELGFVTRSEDPDDRRASVVRVSAAGRREISRQRRTRWAPIADRLADVAPADRERFVTFLEHLADAAAPSTSKTGKAPA